MSRPARGAWIETFSFFISYLLDLCRAPHGARGLKPGQIRDHCIPQVSRPARGAWIETHRYKADIFWLSRRAPHGARGLKHDVAW